MRYLIFALPLLAAGLAYAIDLPRTFGAHPWWSRDVLLYGAPIGIAFAYLAQRLSSRTLLAVLGFAAQSALSYGAAAIGKARFAASHAEDALAGQAWFFGWIAVAVFAAATLGAIGTALSRARHQ